MEIVDGMVQYTLEYKDGREEVLTVEKALISIGRVPNVENLGLSEVGMKLDSRGFAEDEDTQTSIPNIYAVGDFTADIALVNIAEMEGRYAVEAMYGQIDHVLVLWLCRGDGRCLCLNRGTKQFLPVPGSCALHRWFRRSHGIRTRKAGSTHAPRAALRFDEQARSGVSGYQGRTSEIGRSGTRTAIGTDAQRGYGVR